MRIQLNLKLLKQEIKQTAYLAIPISIGQLGHVLTGVADYTMLGHTNPTEMAGATFATSIFFPFMILGLGFALGLTPLVAQNNGSKSLSKMSELFKTGFKINFFVGLVLFLFLLFLSTQLHILNQPPEVVEVCKKYFLLISISIIPIMLFSALKQFLEGLQNTLTPMIISLTGNVINVLLNYFLIFDHGSFGGLGIEGAGWATLIARSFMVILFLSFYCWKKRLRDILFSVLNNVFQFDHLKEILNIGLPISIYMFFEVTAFSAATFMMGWISEAHIAAHQAALSLASISFVVIMGVGNSGSIRTATYLGEQKIVGIKNVLFSVVIISLLLSTLSAFVFMFFNDELPFLFVNSNESEIIELASCLLLYAALFQFSDGLQVVFQGLLQGIGDVKIPSIIAASSYWFVGIPLGYLLTFYTSIGYSGIWIGLTVGLTFSAILQIKRYVYSFKKLLAKIP